MEKEKVDNQMLVIFGASGDLTYRKLVPALFDLYRQGALPDNFAVLGVARSQFSDETFRNTPATFLSPCCYFCHPPFFLTIRILG